ELSLLLNNKYLNIDTVSVSPITCLAITSGVGCCALLNLFFLFLLLSLSCSSELSESESDDDDESESLSLSSESFLVFLIDTFLDDFFSDFSGFLSVLPDAFLVLDAGFLLSTFFLSAGFFVEVFLVDLPDVFFSS